MSKYESIPHPLYSDEPIDIVVPDWVAKNAYRVPRLKMESRKTPKTPWELNDEIKEKLESRRGLWKIMTKRQAGKDDLKQLGMAAERLGIE